MTNTNIYFSSNNFQTVNNNFIVSFFTNSYILINDNNNNVGYSILKKLKLI